MFLFKQHIFIICLACLTLQAFPQTTPDTSVLKTVIVSGKKNPIKPTLDGFVYNAANDAAIAAGNAADVLRRIPLVTVLQDGGIRVRGSSNVRVFIDNKPSEIYAASIADALQQIPAEDIASIEVITQPSARYDAEGTDAVINIITKKNKNDGLDGRVRGVIGNRSQSAGLSLKARKGKMILAFDGNWNRYNNTIRHNTERTGTWYHLQQQKDAGNVMNTYVGGLMATWMIDSLHTVNTGYRIRDMKDKSHSLLSTHYNMQDTVLDYDRYSDNRFHVLGNIINAGYTGFSRNKKREVNVLGTYFLFREKNGYDLRQTDDGKVNNMEQNRASIDNGVLIVQSDLVQSFGVGSKIEAGLKGVWRNNGSDNDLMVYYVKDEKRSNRFKYNRDIYAGYFNYQYIGTKWSLRVGARYEQSGMNVFVKDSAVQVPGDYNWLPNLLVSRDLGRKHTLKLSYAKKIERPYTFYLNPTVNYIDSLNIEYGNPELLPELIHSGQLVYNYTGHGFLANLSLFVDYRRRTIGQVRILSGGVSATTYRNMSGNLIYGANASITYNSGDKLTASSGVVVQYIELSNDALSLKNSGYTVSANGRLSYAFSKQLTVESAVQMEPRSIRLQGSFDGWFFYSMALHKKWWKDRLMTSFTMENFFTRYQYRQERLQGEGFYQTIDGRYPVGFFKLGVSWKFGRKEIREPARREAGE